MKVNITPHRPGQGGILCLPMLKNIPNGREGWKKAACTECAIRRGND